MRQTLNEKSSRGTRYGSSLCWLDVSCFLLPDGFIGGFVMCFLVLFGLVSIRVFFLCVCVFAALMIVFFIAWWFLLVVLLCVLILFGLVFKDDLLWFFSPFYYHLSMLVSIKDLLGFFSFSFFSFWFWLKDRVSYYLIFLLVVLLCVGLIRVSFHKRCFITFPFLLTVKKIWKRVSKVRLI